MTSTVMEELADSCKLVAVIDVIIVSGTKQCVAMIGY